MIIEKRMMIIMMNTKMESVTTDDVNPEGEQKRVRSWDKKPRKKRGPPSEETRKKKSESMIGYIYKQEWKDNQSSRMLGRTMSEEQKQKISRTMRMKNHKEDEHDK